VPLLLLSLYSVFFLSAAQNFNRIEILVPGRPIPSTGLCATERFFLLLADRSSLFSLFFLFLLAALVLGRQGEPVNGTMHLNSTGTVFSLCSCLQLTVYSNFFRRSVQPSACYFYSRLTPWRWLGRLCTPLMWGPAVITAGESIPSGGCTASGHGAVG
jgi:hypothetical protein